MAAEYEYAFCIMKKEPFPALQMAGKVSCKYKNVVII